MTIEGINILGTHEATDNWEPPIVDGIAIAYRAVQHGAIVMEYGQADLNSTYMWMIWVDNIFMSGGC